MATEVVKTKAGTNYLTEAEEIAKTNRPRGISYC
jgi:hypothetical protein